MDVFAQYLPLIVRALERLVIIIFGGLSVYWGYRLFSQTLPTESELVATGGQYKITLKRVGPGVLFALFGAGILIAGLWLGLQYKPGATENVVRNDVDGGAELGQFSYVQGGSALDISKQEATATVLAINKMIHLASTHLPPDSLERGELSNAVARLETLRGTLIDIVVGKDALKRFGEIEAGKPKSEAELSPSDRSLYVEVKNLLEAR